MLSYCANQVKQANRFDFQLCLFAGSKDQEALFSLFAFDQEVAKIPLVTSESITGLIRLQWWQDAIDEIYGGTPRKHPVVEALAETVCSRDLPKELFDLYLQHREWELEPEDKASSVVITDYFDQVFGGFHHILLLTLRPDADKHLIAQARNVGATWGSLNLLAQLVAANQPKDQRLVVIEGGEQLEGNFQVLPDFLKTRLLEEPLGLAKAPNKLAPVFGRSLANQSCLKLVRSDQAEALPRELSKLAQQGAALRLTWYRMTGR